MAANESSEFKEICNKSYDQNFDIQERSNVAYKCDEPGNDSPSCRDSSDDEIDPRFEEKFLDECYEIRDEVHETFRSFSWLQGEYGTVGPNEKVPYFHLYVTVEGLKDRSEEALKQEIDAKLGAGSSVYFEFRPKPLKEPTFRFV